MCSLKKCPKCGIEKPLTTEFFRIESRSRTGFESRCKECNRSDKSKQRAKEVSLGIRVCTDCKIEKPISEFERGRYDRYAKDSSVKTTRSICFPCHAKRMRENRLKNKQVNPEYNSIREKLNSARKRAKDSGYPFDLSIEDLMPFPTHCEVLGIELKYIAYGNDRPDGLATLDKLIPDLGYVKGNVKIISHKANRLKSDLDLETLELLKAYMLRNIKV